MRQVTISPAAIRTSALGYGCASLMARTSRTESVALLEEAFEAGITHFDVARSYGYGEAESALGAFLQHHRDQVTVATKLGIAPPRASAAMALAKGAVRAGAAVVPSLGRVARRRAQGFVKAGRFEVADAKASLEISLRELGTGYVDLLFLHDAQPEDVSEDLVGFLQSCVRSGSVRSYGIATDPEAARATLTTRPQAAQVVQLPNALTAPAVQAIRELDGRALITHSALGDALDAVHRHVSEDPDRVRRWSEVVGADCSQRNVLGDHMLAWASFANPTGVVVFSSRNPARIRANAQGAPHTPREQVERLAALVRQEMVA